MGRTIAGVEVMPSRNEARDAEYGKWINRHAFVRDVPGLVDVLGVMWADCWREASLDTIRRNDQAGIIGLELARRLQEHVELILQGCQR